MTDGLLIKDLRERIKRGQVVTVIGAGVSTSATNQNPFASWTRLLEDGVSRCWQLAQPLPVGWKERVHSEIHSDDMEDNLSAAEKVCCKLRKWGEYSRWLRETIGKLKAEHRDVLEALRDLKVALTTTNYDGLIEEVTNLPAITWMDGAKVERVICGDDEGVLHLYGYWDKPESVILGIRSYEKVIGDAHAQNVLRALHTMKTLLFVGFDSNLKDPNFNELLRWTGTLSYEDNEYRRFRLAKEEEVVALQKEHPPEQRLFVLSFGKDHSYLAPFLTKFRTDISQTATPLVPGGKSAALPPPPRCFGREVELEELVAALLAENPEAVSVLGPPGIGKTTISLAALHDRRVVQRYGARRYFIRCDGIKTQEALAGCIAQAIGVKPSSGIEPIIVALEVDPVEPTVLVIDNAETPWDADTLRVEEFLRKIAQIPSLALVATIRGTERPSGVGWQKKSIQTPSLPRQAARDTFLAIAGQKFENDTHLNDLLLALDDDPLAVTLMAHAAEDQLDLDAIWKRWQQERTELLGRAGGKETLNIEVSYATSISGPHMKVEVRRLLALMAYLPKGVAPAELEGIFPVHCHRTAGILERAGLAFYESGRFRILATLREYVFRKHLPDPDDLKQLIGFYVDLAAIAKAGNTGGM